MPRSFDACVARLVADGVGRDKACRACTAAFWAENGMFPEDADRSGIEPGGDCTDYAGFCVAEMSTSEGVGAVFFGGPPEVVTEPAKLQAFGLNGAEKEPHRLLVEVRMLSPGKLVDSTGKEFEFTPDDMLAYRDNFDPLDHPPVLLDHELSARATVGRIRGLSVNADYELMGLWEILGTENVKPVEDKRWSRTSGRFVQSKDRSQVVVIEGSIVWSGAYNRGFGDRAQILSRNSKGAERTMNIKPTLPATSQDSPAGQNEAKAPTVAELAAQVESLSAKLAERDKLIEEASAPVALLSEGSEVASVSESAVVAELSARIQQLETERAEEKRVARLQADANQVFELVKAGKSTPEMHEQELAVLNGMPEALRPKYLELRQKLPNVWPAGARQSVAVAKAPGAGDTQAQEEAEYAQLGAAQGFAPIKKEAK